MVNLFKALVSLVVGSVVYRRYEDPTALGHSPVKMPVTVITLIGLVVFSILHPVVRNSLRRMDE